MVRHVVLLRWNEGTTADQVASVVERLRALPGRIDAIRSYEVGVDLALRAGSADLAIVALFDDAEGFRTYLEHPAHVAVVDELIDPLAADRTSVQFQPDGGPFV